MLFLKDRKRQLNIRIFVFFQVEKKKKNTSTLLGPLQEREHVRLMQFYKIIYHHMLPTSNSGYFGLTYCFYSIGNTSTLPQGLLNILLLSWSKELIGTGEVYHDPEWTSTFPLFCQIVFSKLQNVKNTVFATVMSPACGWLPFWMPAGFPGTRATQ